MADIDTCLLDVNLSRAQLEQTAESMGVELDDATAGAVIKKHKEDLKWNSRRYRINMAAHSRLSGVVKRNVDAGMTPKEAVAAILVRDLRDRSGTVGVDQLAQGYLMSWSTFLDEAAEEFKPTMTGGVKNADLLRDAIRVVRGGQAADAKANRIGSALRQVFERSHQALLDAGADIGYIVNYSPQKHMPNKLQKAGPETWINDVMEVIDRRAMLDDNGHQLNEKDLRDLLEFMYYTITTNGASKVRDKLPKVVQKRFRGPMATKNGLHRTIHFKDADSYIKYNDKYGSDDMWGDINMHLHSMAIDTALHRTFGADVDAGFKRWRDWAEKQDAGIDLSGIDNIWENIIGFDMLGENPLSKHVNAGRDIISSAFMGSAVISSIPDLALTALNAHMNGLSPFKVITGMFKSGELSRRQLAQTVGMIDYANSNMALSPRFEESWGAGPARRLADANYRLSGMTGWINRLRHAWMSEMQLNLGRHRNKSFDALPDELKGFLTTYGLESRWDDIRVANTQDFHGGAILDFQSLNDYDLVAQVLGAINTERDLAVLHPDARTRAALNFGVRPGTIQGEGLRSIMQFKTFPATLLMHGLYRYAFSDRIAGGSRFNYLMAMAVSMTLLGAVSYQLKELLKGREMRDMDPTTEGGRDFWARAFAQGGAMPMLMELILDQQTRHGGGMLEGALGPLGSVLNLPVDAAFGKGEWQERIGRNVEKGTMFIPGQSMWWARLAVQRGLRDQALNMLDPTYADRQERRAEFRLNNFDQDEWLGFDD